MWILWASVLELHVSIGFLKILFSLSNVLLLLGLKMAVSFSKYGQFAIIAVPKSLSVVWVGTDNNYKGCITCG